MLTHKLSYNCTSKEVASDIFGLLYITLSRFRASVYLEQCASVIHLVLSDEAYAFLADTISMKGWTHYELTDLPSVHIAVI